MISKNANELINGVFYFLLNIIDKVPLSLAVKTIISRFLVPACSSVSRDHDYTLLIYMLLT